jgi:hypothetical protein
MYWSPFKNKECMAEFNSLTEFSKEHKEFSANSKYLLNYESPLFKNWRLGNFELLEGFKGSKAAAKLPDKVRELLEVSEENSAFIGAYPTN